MKAIALILALFQANIQAQETRWEDLENRQHLQPKNMVIYIYTDWCHYCNAMKKVLQDSNISEILRKDYEYLILNAESQSKIVFRGKTYHYRPKGYRLGLHTLAEELGSSDGKLGFPTLVILSQNNDILFRYNGYLTKKQLEKILEQYKN